MESLGASHSPHATSSARSHDDHVAPNPFSTDDAGTDSALEERVAQLYAEATILDLLDLQALIRERSLYDLALLALAFHDEAISVTADPDRGHVLMLQLIALIHQQLPPGDYPFFESSLAEVMEGYTEHSAEVLDLVPTFDYAIRDDGAVSIRIEFPADAEA